jgi:hypothetical protein
MGVGGTSEMSRASRRAAVLERHRILWLLALQFASVSCTTYCGAARRAGRRVRDGAAVRKSGLSDLEMDAMVCNFQVTVRKERRCVGVYESRVDGQSRRICRGAEG